MIHYDYTWDLYPNYMLLDEELNIDALGWKEGDYFKVEKVNGRMILRKVEKIEAFLTCGNN